MSAFSEEGSDPALDGEILLILCVTLGNIAGKGAEIDDEKQYRIDDAALGQQLLSEENYRETTSFGSPASVATSMP